MVDDNQTKENLLNSMSQLKKQVQKLKENLDNGALNVNKQIKDIISLIMTVGKLKKDVTFSEDENTKFENEYSDLKTKFKRLKSLHIEKYNEKVRSVNRRFSKISQKLLDRTLTEDIKQEIKRVPLLRQCNILINNKQWRENKYLDTLEYGEIEVAELMITQLETKLNIKNDNVTDRMYSMVDEIDDVLKKIEQNIGNDLTIEDINKYLFECGTLLGGLLVLNTEHEKLRDKISPVMFSEFSSKIVNLQIRLGDVRKNLSNKEQIVNENSVYDTLKLELEILERDYTELVEMYFKNETKCTKELVVEYRRFLNKFSKRLNNVTSQVNDSFNEGRINQQQLENLKDRMFTITSIDRELNEKLDNEPILVNSNKKNFGDDYFLSIEKDLQKLKKVITDLGEGPIRDKEKRKNVETIINELDKSLEGLNSFLLRYSKVDNEKYIAYKNKYDGYKEEFDELNHSYSAKCPLVVKTIREAKPIYKKHKKLGLISAGLASISLVTSSYTLVPAIMHGNAMLGNAVPAFKGMMSFFNKILGSMIGASVGKNGAWVLATGAILNGTVATTAILKFLATIGVGTAALTAPLYIPQIISKVKELVEKIKAYDLKQKLSDTYQSGVKKVKETVKKVEEKIDEYDLTNYYNELYSIYMYNSKKMTLDEFCKRNKLTEGDKKVLSLMVSRGKIEDEFKKIVGEQVSNNNKRKAKLA